MYQIIKKKYFFLHYCHIKHPSDKYNNLLLYNNNKCCDIHKYKKIYISLNNGCNPNLRTDIDTFLTLFVKYKYYSCTRLCLRYNSNPNITPNFYYIFPIYIAIINKNKYLSKLLLKFNSHLNKINSYSTFIDILDCIFNNNKTNIIYFITLILKYNFNCNIKDIYRKKDTILHRICSYQYEDKNIITLLLEHGATIDKQNIDGYTPLHLACYYDHLNYVKELIKYGANINIQNYRGDTPLITAIVSFNYKIIEYLLHAGANPNICENTGYNSLDMAIEYNADGHHDNTIKLIKKYINNDN